VIGVSNPVGEAIAATLRDTPWVGQVLAVDSTRTTLPGVRWHISDLSDPVVTERLTGVDVVVNASLDLSPDTPPRDRATRNRFITESITRAVVAAGVARVVHIGSAMVYGARPDNLVPMPEEAPAAARPEGVPGDLLMAERVLHALTAGTGTALTVLRPAAITGPGVDTLVSRHFAAPRLLQVRDGGMRWQFCHRDDLATAVRAVLDPSRAETLDGVLTCGSAGWLTPHEVATACGLRRVELPAGLAFSTAERLHRAGVVPAPASELAYVTFPWVVPSTRLLGAGWRPRYDNMTAFQALLESIRDENALAGRRLGRKDATVAGAGAAGATLAVLGAAAFVRRARRLRGL